MLCAIVALHGPARAEVRASQAANAHWSEPVNLSNTGTSSQFPAILADKSGAVHVFWAEAVNESLNYTSAIMYTRWDGTSWTQPVDVLISPEGPQSLASEPSAVVDADGQLHLVWRGGWSGQVYYSWAGISSAGSAQGWTKPHLLNPEGGSGSKPVIAIDGEGALHVVYPVATGSEQGVYYLFSSNAGATWSPPVLIPESRLGDGTMLDSTALAAGSDGTIHVAWAWAEYPESFPPKGVYYARSSDHGKTWSSPWPNPGPYSLPCLAAKGDSDVHMVWSGTGTEQTRLKYHSYSADGGLVWSPPDLVPGLGGFQGTCAMGVDSSGTLNLALVGTDLVARVDVLAHSTWEDRRWTQPVSLLENSVSMQNLQYADIAISEGNLVHAVVMYPVAASTEMGYQFDIFYVGGRLDAPHQDPESLPERQRPADAAPTLTPSPASPVPAPNAIPASAAAPSPGSDQPRPQRLPALAVGLSAVVFALSVIAVAREVRRGRR